MENSSRIKIKSSILISIISIVKQMTYLKIVLNLHIFCNTKCVSIISGLRDIHHYLYFESHDGFILNNLLKQFTPVLNLLEHLFIILTCQI